ncbi:MAG TPA: DUF932 domain-containing protein [Thermoanaerobaculia bacterium]|nr:DUF932 domain-containing protein [Thermoanaerobaculia bacterium]
MPEKEILMPLTEPSVLTRAFDEWWKRPDDERYLTLDHLYASTRARAEASEARTIVNTSLLVRGSADAGGELSLEHDDLGTLDPTHWSLGQLATISHTPAKWIREVAPVRTGPAIAAHAINLGLRHLAERALIQVMKLPTGPGLPTGKLRCIVGPDYGRIYDHEVVRAVMDANEDGRWHIPAASYQAKNPKRATTLYASDRDVFIFLVDEKNPVSVHVEGSVRNLFRGFMVWNSEVGHHKFGFMTFLYDYVCDNRMVWGAREVKEISIKHTKNAPDRFAREVRPMLRAYAEASVVDVEAQLERATRKKVGSSDEEVLDWLRRHEFTKKEGEAIVRTAKAEEGGARTVWELVNGGTAVARAIPHNDDRVLLEKRVSGLLRAA